MPAAGGMDQYLLVQNKVATKNAYLEDVNAWSDFTRIWARAITAKPQEVFAAGGQQSVETVVFWTHYREDLTTDMRVQWRGYFWDVAGVTPKFRNEGLELVCQRGVRDSLQP